MQMTSEGETAQATDWKAWHHIFVMITRGWIDEFSDLSRNAWRLYLVLGTFYNKDQKRSFPTLQMLESVVPLTPPARSKALAELTRRGLIEVWGTKLGRKRRTYYRMLHVDERCRHTREPQQQSEQELRDLRRQGPLPREFEWLDVDYRKGTGAEIS